MNKKILVLGHAHHGKDVFAYYLGKYWNIQYVSSSVAALNRFLLDILKERHGYTSVQEAMLDRDNHRLEWFHEIEKYNTPDKARLVREVLEIHDMYIGLRSAEEYEAAKDLFDLVFWVDRSPIVPSDPTMKILYDPQSMIRVYNGGTLRDLENFVITKMGEFLYGR